MSPQFDGEICEIGVTSHEDNKIGAHLAVLTELPTFDSSTRISTLERCEPFEFFFGTTRMNYVRAIVARTTFRIRNISPNRAWSFSFCKLTEQRVSVL